MPLKTGGTMGGVLREPRDLALLVALVACACASDNGRLDGGAGDASGGDASGSEDAALEESDASLDAETSDRGVTDGGGSQAIDCATLAANPRLEGGQDLTLDL